MRFTALSDYASRQCSRTTDEGIDMKMTVKELKEALEGVADDVPVVFQGNIPNEEDEDEGDEPSYTTCCGYAYSAFLRTEVPSEFVIDCAITESEI